MKYQYAKLQNGSDIRGVAMATDPALPVNLDEEAAGRLALGFLFLLTVRTGKQPRELIVAIGRDSRLTGEALAAAAARSLISKGARVLAAGLASQEGTAPDVVRLRLQPGSTALIASDGVVADPEDGWVKDLLDQEQTDMKRLARTVLRKAEELYGAGDDMTVLALRVEERL